MTNLYSRLTQCFPGDVEAVFASTEFGPVTYRELDAASARYANALRKLGVDIGDRVVVQAEKSIEMVMLYLACLRAGAILLPLNPAYTIPEVAYFIGDSEPALVVHDPGKTAEPGGEGWSGSIKSIALTGPRSLAEVAASCADAFATLARDDDDLAAILYTSGTTGRSKGAMITHGNLISNAFTLRDYWGFTSEDVLLHALPIFHTHGLFVAINVTLAAGASMIFQGKFDLDAVFGAMPGATVMMGVPTFYSRMLDDPRLDRASAAHVRLFVSGSAPLPVEVHHAFERVTGHAILERYGMTETNMNTSNPLHGERVPGTVGFPLPGVTVRITDPQEGCPLPAGEVGMIEVSGPNVFKGYWRMPEKTAEEFRDGFFITGDLGRFDERGYLSIVGRQKDLIIAGGLNIYPADVETAIGAVACVREVAVIGVAHPDLGEAVVAVVVGQPDDPRPDSERAAEIMSALATTLARFKQPRQIVFAPQLPKNAMGKIQKASLREEFGSIFSNLRD